MEKTKLCLCLAVLALVGTVGMAETAAADENGGFGPPAWVIEAWENGEMPSREFGYGPPPRVLARHALAKELGLPGPPPEVIEAWENGEGFDLPGPPDFVLDLLGF